MKDQTINVEWELIDTWWEEHHLVNWLTLGSIVLFYVCMSTLGGYTTTQFIQLIQRSEVIDGSSCTIIVNITAVIFTILYNLIRRR